MKGKVENTNPEDSPQIFNILKSLGKNKFSRREFIEAATVTSGAVALSACSGPKSSFSATTKNTTTSLYAGPGRNYQRIGSLRKGRKVTINGKNETGNWFRMSVNRGSVVGLIKSQTGDTITAWLEKVLVNYGNNSTDGLNVIEAPPTPIPTPTRTPTVKPARTPTRRPSSSKGGTICTCNKVTYWYPN